jgi:hypothetical protein
MGVKTQAVPSPPACRRDAMFERRMEDDPARLGPNRIDPARLDPARIDIDKEDGRGGARPPAQNRRAAEGGRLSRMVSHAVHPAEAAETAASNAIR